MNKFILKFYIVAFLLFFVAPPLSSAQTFFTDSEHLDSVRPGLLDAYKERVKIFDAWDLIRGKEINFTTTTIGIIDTGIDASSFVADSTVFIGRHPEFDGVNFGSSGFDDLQDQAEFLSEFLRPELRRGHGTQVAGIIGANNLSPDQDLPINSLQMNGIISGVTDKYILESRSTRFLKLGPQVMPLVKLISATPHGSVINISLGGAKCSEVGHAPCIPDEDFDATTDYFEEGIDGRTDLLFMIGAGNDGIKSQSSTPAKIKRDNALIVGATELDDQRASFSNFGSGVDISAPGVDVYAPSIRGKGNIPIVPPRDYVTDFNGTSASTPFVTGVAAILKSINPLLSPSEIKDILIRTADPIQTGEPDKRLGIGCYTNPNDPINTGCRLNALRAVQDILGIPAIPDIRGLYTGSAVSTLTNCQNPADNITISWPHATINISGQLNGDFSGTGVLTAALDSNSLRDDLVFSGTVSSQGNIAADIANSFFINNLFQSGGQGTVTGQFLNNALDLSFSTQDIVGDTCSVQGTLTAVRQ